MTRRGFGPERVAAVGSLADAPGAAVLPVSAVGAGWVEATVKSAQAYVAGRAAAAGVVPALALTLGDEVVRSLAMSPWKFVMLALLTLGTTSTVAVGLVSNGGGGGDGQAGSRGGPRESPSVVAEAPPAKKESPPAIKDLPAPVEDMLPKQAKRILAAAQTRVEAQRAFYEEGRITINRYLEALQLLNAAESELATTREERILASQAHMERLETVLKRELDELNTGRGTVADVAEASLALDRATLEWLKAHKPPPAEEDVSLLRKRVETLEKQLEHLKQQSKRVEDPR